ncbi:MAG: glycosyltransferase family 87 protein [Thermoanaerobaculales bacterium]
MFVALAVAMLALAATPVVSAVRGRCQYDYNLWYVTAKDYLHNHAIYARGIGVPFEYPPSAAAMLAIAALLGKAVFVFVLVAINSVAWFASVALTVWLVTGRVGRQHPLLSLLPTLAMTYWILDTYKLGQPALVLLALMLGAAASLRRRRPGLAGALIGTAAAIKASPVLAVGYLVYRRHWTAMAAAIIALLGWLLVFPLAFRPAWGVFDDLSAWTKTVVLTYDARTISQRGLQGYSFKNQSIVGVANRLLRPVPADGEEASGWTVNLTTLGFGTVNAVILASVLGLGLFFLWCTPSDRSRTCRSDTIEWAMLLLLIVMVTPLSLDYSYVWMLYPLGVATAALLDAEQEIQPRRGLFWWVAASLLVHALTLPMHHMAGAYGNLFLSALILFVGLGLAMRKATSGRQGSPASPLG